ncbi:MAG: hypothetical protein BKP49_07825 [Treponema sp. CETP13]|nr:MAG: hypothetical protein BKP49_07825 [Treponema sp. CETP13]
MKERAILAISHSNYIINSAGTEKCIRDIENLLNKEGIYYIQIFPVRFKNCIGVYFKKKFRGIYSYSDIIGLLQKYKIDLIGIHIHHLLYHNLHNIINLLKELNLPITYFVHDYYAICSNYNLINSSGNYCGMSFPNKKKCANCSYYATSIYKHKEFENFFKTLANLIYKIITPSQFVATAWQNVYPIHTNKILIRNHLVPSRQNCIITNKKNTKLRIAYCGAKANAKGFMEWEKLILENKEKFEFFYLGTDKNKEKNVTNIYVNNVLQGSNAMTNALIQNHIDVVFLWSTWPETYCYVYYEASMANCIIITNTISGNVANEVEKVGNGFIFDSLQDLQDNINNKSFHNAVLDIYKNNILIPKQYSANESLDGLLFETNKDKIKYPKRFCTKKVLLSYCYAIKHKLRLY